jgi:hypothetical protein
MMTTNELLVLLYSELGKSEKTDYELWELVKDHCLKNGLVRKMPSKGGEKDGNREELDIF